VADPSEERDPLEELAEDFLDRRRRGLDPSIGDFLARCPCRREEFRDLLSALMAVEDLKPGADETCGRPRRAASPADGLPFQRLGEYRILREIGRGGMGVVFEAEQESLGRRVALKVLAPWARAEPQQLQRFLREARSAAQLHHPHIVAIFGVGEDDGLHYYAMQFIRGLGLDQVLDEVRYLRGVPAGTRRSAVGHDAATRVNPLLVAGPADTTPLLLSPGEDSGPAEAAALPRESGWVVPLPGYDDASETEDSVSRYPHAAARICAQVAEALQYAHDQGMLHRDIKPSNLLLDELGKVWVTDFGLVKAAGGEDLTETGDLVGTLRYMAPEQFRGRCDARSDVYSLGLTLYELLALRPAFEAPDRQRLIHQITQGEPQPIRRLMPGLPRDLETIVHTAIARDPADRYASAELLADDLRRWLRHEPIRARPISLHERLVKWTRRNPTLAALTAACVLATITTLAALATGYARVASMLQREQRISYFQRIALAERAWSSNDVGRAEALLDETPEAFRSWEWRYLKRLCHADLLTLKVNEGIQPNAVAFAPDGATVATADKNGGIAIRETSSGRLVRMLPGHPGGVLGLAFRRDGTAIASAGQDREVRVWDVATGRMVCSCLPALGREALTVAFSPEGEILATGTGAFWETVERATQDGELALWDARSGRHLRTLRGHAGSVHHVAFAPDGGRLASAGSDGQVRVWDPATGDLMLDLHGHDGVVMGVAYRSDGRRLASAGLDGTLRVWDARRGDPLVTVREPGEKFLAVAFSPDGRRLAAAGRSWAVTVWDADTGLRLGMYRGHDREAIGVAFSPDGRRLASAGFDGLVRVWDATRGQEALTLEGFNDPITAVAIDPRGCTVATADEGGPARLWSVDTGRPGPALDAASGPHSAVAFHPDGSLLATGSRCSGLVELWDAATGRRVQPLDSGCERITAVAFSPDGTVLASGSADGSVALWDVPAGRLRASFVAGSLPVTALAFHPDSRRLAASTSDAKDSKAAGQVVIRDLVSGRTALILRGHRAGISDIAFSPDGRLLATASWDRTVALWDSSSGVRERAFEIRGLIVWAVAFSPDGRRVVAADNIGRMTLWDVESGYEVLTLRGHTDRIYDLAFSAGGRLLATAGRDATVKVWDATPLPTGDGDR
jgi:WD40 repeat protein/serine/threonine protein kinase